MTERQPAGDAKQLQHERPISPIEVHVLLGIYLSLDICNHLLDLYVYHFCAGMTVSREDHHRALAMAIRQVPPDWK